MAPQQQVNLPNEELDWIQMRQESGPVFPETTKEKMMRKIKENPLVPIGKPSNVLFISQTYIRKDNQMKIFLSCIYLRVG